MLGFVWRLSVETDVRSLARVQRELERLDQTRSRFMIIGHGQRRLAAAEPTRRVVHGRAERRGAGLSIRRYELFVFPSHTDTFGNVVLEALASGVAAIVTPDGGPASIVRDGQIGRVVPDVLFASAIAAVLDDATIHRQMRTAARNDATNATWNSVFETVYRGYFHVLEQHSCAPSRVETKLAEIE